MRPTQIIILPDINNDWHWFIYDWAFNLIAQSDQGYFHLIDARKAAESYLLRLAA